LPDPLGYLESGHKAPPTVLPMNPEMGYGTNKGFPTPISSKRYGALLAEVVPGRQCARFSRLSSVRHVAKTNSANDMQFHSQIDGATDRFTQPGAAARRCWIAIPLLIERLDRKWAMNGHFLFCADRSRRASFSQHTNRTAVSDALPVRNRRARSESAVTLRMPTTQMATMSGIAGVIGLNLIYAPSINPSAGEV